MAPKKRNEMPATLKGEDGVTRWDFESVAHLVTISLTKGAGREKGNTKYADERQTMHSRRAQWTDGRNVKDVVASLTSAPDRFLAAISEAKTRIEDKIESPTRNRRKLRSRQVEGDELDVQAWLRRETDGWSQVHKIPRRKSVVTIAVNVLVHCGRQPSELLWRGATAAALADVLTDLGHSVEIVAFMCYGDLYKNGEYSDKHVLRIPVKESHQPMDMSSVAEALCDIAFFRIAGINAALRISEQRCGYGVGKETTLPDHERNEFDLVLDTGATSEDKAVGSVIEKLGLEKKKN
jgi:sulfur carrier protein ThiS